MYTYHLWIILRESTLEADEGSLAAKLDELGSLVKTKLEPVPDVPVVAVNYDHVLQFSESHNHRGDVHQRLLDVLSWLAKELPGSYGLVYWYDDEIPGRDNYDGYRVMVVARGEIRHCYDPFLSPTTPVVED